MFRMRARLSVPGQVAIAALREELEELETQTNLDVRLTPFPPEPLAE
jgi:glycine cleavage system regulatory protein